MATEGTSEGGSGGTGNWEGLLRAWGWGPGGDGSCRTVSAAMSQARLPGLEPCLCAGSLLLRRLFSNWKVEATFSLQCTGFPLGWHLCCAAQTLGCQGFCSCSGGAQ